MLLSELDNKESGVIVKVKGRGAFRRRITEMGFVKGQTVIVIKDAPLKDPVEYLIMGYKVSLRRSEADLIEVITPKEALNHTTPKYNGTTFEDILKDTAKEKSRIINVALVGNPNSGKTSLFNQASGSSEHVGNYSGVTVEAKIAKFKHNGYTIHLVDLPGTYSISAYSPEELYVRKHIIENMPDIVINVLDATNLKRNLFLTTQLIDMDIKVIAALNMYDDLIKNNIKFNFKEIGHLLGIPFVPTIAAKGTGITDLFNKVIEVYEDQETIVRHIHINYGFNVEKSISIIQQNIKKNKSLTDNISSRFLAIKLLERDQEAINNITGTISNTNIKEIVYKEIANIEGIYKDSSETIIADARYGFISGALKETYVEKTDTERRKVSDIIDNFATNKFFGFPVFMIFLGLMFYTTFTLGAYPKEWIENGVKLLAKIAESMIPTGDLKNLIIDGIIGGVGGVIVFLPNILILFLFISFLEDTGYMARVAFIMDKLMHKIGLHGKSFIPMIMGFGCAVPAIMSTRTIENRGDRLLTMLITPFMSCSARLPVYVLIISAFFPSKAAIMLFSIYILGIILAVFFALIFKKTLFRKIEAPFVMELPPYRLPTFRSTVKHMWNKASQYLRKMGGVIMISSIIIWALGYYPRNSESSQKYQAAISGKQKAIQINDHRNTLGITNLKSDIEQLKSGINADQIRQSYLGRLGAFLEPVLSPLGFDWKMGISLFTGIVGKEIVVSSMSIIYQEGDNTDEHAKGLIYKLQNEKYLTGEKSGQKVFTSLVAINFMVFILIYFPCIAVIASIRKESDKWKWAFFTVFYTTAFAWLASFIIYQVGYRILLI